MQKRLIAKTVVAVEVSATTAGSEFMEFQSKISETEQVVENAASLHMLVSLEREKC